MPVRVGARDRLVVGAASAVGPSLDPPTQLLHHADVPSAERSWFGPVPATGVRRTLSDCARGGLSPDELRRAAEQALRRGSVTRNDLADVDAALAPFGGLDG